MPYINEEQRAFADALLKPVLDNVKLLTKGEVNYIITKIVAGKYAYGDYVWRSEGASVLQDAHDEYYRRVMAPYEDEKRKEHGDVF